MPSSSVSHMHEIFAPLSLSIFCCILQFLPIVLGLKLKCQESLTISLDLNESSVALIGSVAVSLPMGLDLLMDIISQTITHSYQQLEKGWVPKILLVFSLMIPDLFILVLAMPTQNKELIILLFFIRNNFFFCGIYTLMRSINQFFCSNAVIGVFITVLFANTLSIFTWYDIGFPQFLLLSHLVNGIAACLLLWILASWCHKMYGVSVKDFSREELMASSLLLSMVTYIIIVIIVQFFTGGHDIESQLPVTTYAEATFTVILWLLQRRILLREVTKKSDELEFKRMFVRYISHEVRTPLNTATMGVQVLTEDLMGAMADNETIQTIVDVKTSMDIAVNVLNELLTFDKLESGTLLLERTELNAMELIEKTVKPFQVQAKRAKVSLSIIPNDEIILLITKTAKIYADDNKVAQVLRNLVSNGLKFTPKGGKVEVFVDIVNVEVNRSAITKYAEPVKHLVISVTDTGPGISEENQKKLFNDIVQFNPGKLQGGGGSGIGLYISHGIVKLHEGELSVASKGEGHGCTFTLTLPLCEDRISQYGGNPFSPVSLRRIGNNSAFFRLDSTTRGSTRFTARNKVACTTSSMDVRSFHDSDRRSENSQGKLSSRGLLSGRSSLPDAAIAALSRENSTRMSRVITGYNVYGPLLSPKGAMKSLSTHLELPMASVSPQDETSIPIYEEKTGCPRDQNYRLVDKEENGVETIIPPLCVLVVDDTPLSRKMQCRLLKRRCRAFIEAEDGQQAVDIVNASLASDSENSAIDLILMDSVMPVLSGVLAAKKIREMGYRGIIVGITGNVAQDDIDTFLASGADVVLPKPLDIARFDYAIQNFLSPE